MQTTKYTRSVVTMLAGLALANVGLLAAQEPLPPNDPAFREPKTEKSASEYRDSRSDKSSMHGKHLQASKLIGKEVKNDQGERLGRIDDLIVSDNFKVKFVVLSVGGTLGIGDSKIAVPINDLTCSGDSIRLSATKDELKNAAKTPSGEWSFVSGEEWTKDVTAYYGHPMNTASFNDSNYSYDKNVSEYRSSRSDYPSTTRTFERESFPTSDRTHEDVRATKGSGAKELINHDSNANLYQEWYPEGTGSTLGTTENNSSDNMLRQTVKDTIRNDYNASTANAISVNVDNGVVTLRGTVSSTAEKQNIESSVKALSGVSRVNNQLNIRD